MGIGDDEALRSLAEHFGSLRHINRGRSWRMCYCWP
jgi:hypothetical protein